MSFIAVSKNQVLRKWAHKDSNLGHADYESAALTS